MQRQLMQLMNDYLFLPRLVVGVRQENNLLSLLVD